MFRITLILCALLFAAMTFCQASQTVYHHLDQVTVKQKGTKDSLQLLKNETSALTQFQMNGYLGVTRSDTVYKRTAVHYYYTAQHHFSKVKLIERNGRKKDNTLHKTITRTLTEVNSRLINLENSGFPFAQYNFVEQTEEGEVLALTFELDSGDYFVIEKVNIKSQTAFNEKTVLSLMGIKPGDAYNEQKIRNLSAIFANSGIYITPKAPQVLFKAGEAELYVYIEKKKSSSADGYVGFQQDRVTNRLALNGFINLQLKNALNRAEIIQLNWRNNPDQTQDLKALVEYPYLFGSPIGVGVDLDLQKQDSSFVRSDVTFELIYRNPKFRVSLFNQIEGSSTISKEPIPGFRDYRKNTIGLTVQYRPFMPDILDFYHPLISASGGVFSYRQDTLNDESRRIANNKYFLKYEHTIDFLKFFHLNNSLQYQGLASTNGLSRNEFIYFGGLQSMRGFYELELSGRDNWILRNEIEFKPVDLIALKILYDYANFTNTSKNYAHSFGFGFGLINNNSQLDIIIANGTLNDNPFALSETKVHIGFKSNF